MTDTLETPQSLLVYPGALIRVVQGANLGDALGPIDDIELDDVFQLAPDAPLQRLSLRLPASGPWRIADDSDLGTAGTSVHLEGCLTFMSGQGETTECLVLTETSERDHVKEVFVLPLAPMTPKRDYTLVRADRDSGPEKFAQVACVSFTRGTRITLATGAQCRVEDLEVGDRVLTRDEGPQQIRWIGQTTLRASGAFAPVLIKAGTLNNLGDLVVSPEHRLFVYQRTDHLGAGRSEVLVKARHLINGTTVQPVTGGFVDYFQLLFDRHQIIFAEGIAAESLLLDPRTQAALPAEAGELHDPSFSDLEVSEGLLDRPDAAEVLRKSAGS